MDTKIQSADLSRNGAGSDRGGTLFSGTHFPIPMGGKIALALILCGGGTLTAGATPVSLLLPQSTAFAILGHSCGGIQEKAYVTGFAPSTGYPTGDVYLQTRCSTGGRGGGTITYSGWSAATWDFAGNVLSTTALTTAPAINPTFSATDAYGDQIYNANNLAYLVVPIPGAPTIVKADQAGDQFQVSWTPSNTANPAAMISSTLTAKPVDIAAGMITTTVTGSAANGLIGPLQPKTTYQITVVNTTIGGSSPSSKPATLTTVPASIAPSAPGGVTAHWAGQGATTAALVATWSAAVPGDSPVDQYEITINGSDSGGTFKQTVSGTTLTASFMVDYIPDWSVTLRAHNAIGWGPSSASFTLGGL